MARRAYSFARDAHRAQRRESDAAQFIIHPLGVAALLHNTGHRDSVVAAGILHDTIENSRASTQELVLAFGSEIARIVAAMTEDPTIESFDKRKAALRQQIADFGPDATAVYAADKVAKYASFAAAPRAGKTSSIRNTRRQGASSSTTWPACRCLSG